MQCDLKLAKSVDDEEQRVGTKYFKDYDQILKNITDGKANI